jgi:N utilization substance protein B
MPSRRKARECALQMLFQWDLGKDPPAKVEELFWANTRWIDEPSVRALASQLFRGAAESVAELDNIIRARTEHWRLDRMAAVDRNLLRLGIYELTHCSQTPPIVVINEALEIARKFSGEDSVQFINGVLDAVRKQRETPRSA